MEEIAPSELARIHDHITVVTANIELAHENRDEAGRLDQVEILIRATTVSDATKRNHALNALVLLVSIGAVKATDLAKISPAVEEGLRSKIVEFTGRLWTSRMNNPGITLILAYGFNMIPVSRLNEGIADPALSSRVQDQAGHTLQ